MRIALITESGEVHNLEVDPYMELENIKALIETMTGIAPAGQILSHNEQELTDPKKTLKQYGVIQDELLLLKRSPSSMEQRQGELQRMQQTSMLNADSYGVEAQRRMEEEIKMQNVLANMETTLKDNPESFGRVTMLYINVEVNGHPLKAMVTCGAQATIMSPQCAESCGIMQLVDKRFAGVAKGVGTAKIIGRVHSAQIRLGKTDLCLAWPFTIMEGRRNHLLLGLDLLKRHQACIDLRKNALVINDKEIPFLADHEEIEEWVFV